jgi:hypothetical protein
MISSDELADPERSFNRLLFAAQDMAECSAAVDFLIERREIAGIVRRALETGAVVAYARPWTRGSIEALGDHWPNRARTARPAQRAHEGSTQGLRAHRRRGKGAMGIWRALGSRRPEEADSNPSCVAAVDSRSPS